jgi:radical SAM protein with 4Fe4S-binding SPASM domain
MSDSFFDIKNLEALYKRPPETDPIAWDDYINNQKDAETFKTVPEAPIQIDFELNGSCNMACPFCIHGIGGGRTAENIPLNTYKRLIDEASAMGTKSIKLNYINEPLLRRDLEEAIQYAKSKGIINIYFVTNGSLLTEQRIEALLQSGVTKVFISIDAATEETYNKQRKNGLYKKVVENVKRLVEKRDKLGMEFPKVRVSFLKNKINEHEAELFEQQWIGIVDVITFQTMNKVPGIVTGLTLFENEKPKPCSFPNKQLVVDSSGDILPCCKLWGKELAIGNIENMTLKEAWKSGKMESLRKAHAENNWEMISACRNCLYNNE